MLEGGKNLPLHSLARPRRLSEQNPLVDGPPHHQENTRTASNCEDSPSLYRRGPTLKDAALQLPHVGRTYDLLTDAAYQGPLKPCHT